jgi:hypothetical protein
MSPPELQDRGHSGLKHAAASAVTPPTSAAAAPVNDILDIVPADHDPTCPVSAAHHKRSEWVACTVEAKLVQLGGLISTQ